MTSLVERNKHHNGAADNRIYALLARKPPPLVAAALVARAIWAIIARGEVYRIPALGAVAIWEQIYNQREVAWKRLR